MAFINLPKKVDRRVPTSRKKEYQKIYQDKKWIKIRDVRRMKNPLCEVCLSKGLTEPTTEIHHIIPFSEGLNPFEVNILAFSYENTISLCTKCHKQTHTNYKPDISLRSKLLKR